MCPFPPRMSARTDIQANSAGSQTDIVLINSSAGGHLGTFGLINSGAAGHFPDFGVKNKSGAGGHSRIKLPNRV